jgi:hypothetical protein
MQAAVAGVNDNGSVERSKKAQRTQQRPEHLPAWPNLYGDQRQWWVDGVPVPTSWFAVGFAVLVVLPIAFWAVATNPAGWLGSLVVLVGCVSWVFVVVPWVMRLADLSRRSPR